MHPKTIAALQPGDHLCCIYETEAEHRGLLTPFLRQGLERNQRVLYIVDSHTAEAILGYLRDDGLAVEPYLARGQLGILAPEDAYLRDGSFDPDRMIALLHRETERALAEGYSALRVTGEMTWMLRGLPGSERLIEYETRLNRFLPGNACLAICQYDRRRFDPRLLLDVLSTHPIAVLGTEIYENFYYMPPEEMLGPDPVGATLWHWGENLAAYKRTEEARRASEARYARLFEASRDAIFVINPRGEYLDANPAAVALVGYAIEELRQKTTGDLLPPEEQLPSAEREKAWREGRTVEVNLRHKHGTLIPVELTISPVVEQGELRFAVGIARDVTERKRAEAMLRRYNARLQLQHETDRSVLAALSLVQIADAALGHIRQLVASKRASLAVLEPGAKEMLLLAVHTTAGEGSQLRRGMRVPLDWLWFMEELYQGQVHLEEDLQAVSAPSPLLQQLQAEGVRTYAVVPLIAQGELVGSLNLGLERPAGGLPVHVVDAAKDVAGHGDAVGAGGRSTRSLCHGPRPLEPGLGRWGHRLACFQWRSALQAEAGPLRDLDPTARAFFHGLSFFWTCDSSGACPRVTGYDVRTGGRRSVSFWVLTTEGRQWQCPHPVARQSRSG